MRRYFLPWQSENKNCGFEWDCIQTSVYARDRDQTIMLLYNEFAYKKPKDTHKLGERFLKKANFKSHICEIADKKTTYNEGRLYYYQCKDLLCHKRLHIIYQIIRLIIPVLMYYYIKHLFFVCISKQIIPLNLS
jgi:hypothetical protein